MLVSGDKHDIFISESIGLTDSSTGSRSSIQIRAGFYTFVIDEISDNRPIMQKGRKLKDENIAVNYTRYI
jgi:hypothetical protein